MMRQPLNSAAARGRPDLLRAADGIAASLRHFSMAQARCDDTPQRPSGRQRSAAAANELFSMNEKSRPTNSAPSPAGSAQPTRPTPPVVAAAAAAPRTPQAPTVIRVPNLRGGTGGRFAGARGGAARGNLSGAPTRAPMGAGGHVISGVPSGFRGRGGAFARGRGGGGAAGGRGGAGARGGRGRGRRGDDRPSRDTKQRNAEEAEYQRFAAKEDDPDFDTWSGTIDTGLVHNFQPKLDLLKDLAGYAPAVATSTTPLAQHATVLKQARILGGGRPYSPDDHIDAPLARKMYREGSGVFFPTEEVKKYAMRQARTTFAPAPQETRSAVLDAALLGKYEGPVFGRPDDTLATLKSYVKRDGTWNAHAERAIEAKIKSMLPAAAPSPGAPAPQAKTA